MAVVGDRHGRVKRELLVRLLDNAVPALLHGAKRFTYAEGYAGSGRSAVAALRVFAEFADRLRGRRLTVVLAGGDPATLPARLDATRAELGLPAQIQVTTVSGDCDDHLVPALRAAGAFGAPLLAYLDAAGSAGSALPGYDMIAALAAGRRADVLVALDPAVLTAGADLDRFFGSTDWRASSALPDTERYPYLVTRYREALERTGLDLVVHVELVDDSGASQLLFFATAVEKSLDRFKDTLWAVDEFAGVRYRDPRDHDHALLDISLDPHLGPLRRALLERVRADGECPAAALRRFTRTETIYRAEDAFRAIGGLVSAGRVSRQPERGRLTADTIIRAR
jgi:three-Cys-motif partner protein